MMTKEQRAAAQAAADMAKAALDAAIANEQATTAEIMGAQQVVAEVGGHGGTLARATAARDGAAPKLRGALREAEDVIKGGADAQRQAGKAVYEASAAHAAALLPLVLDDAEQAAAAFEADAQRVTASAAKVRQLRARYTDVLRRAGLGQGVAGVGVVPKDAENAFPAPSEMAAVVYAALWPHRRDPIPEQVALAPVVLTPIPGMAPPTE